MYIYLSKNRVVHQLEEIFLKGVFSHLSLSGVEVNVLLQPWSLGELNPSLSGVEVNVLLQPWSFVELNPSVDIFQHHTKFLVDLQSSIVNGIFVLLM